MSGEERPSISYGQGKPGSENLIDRILSASFKKSREFNLLFEALTAGGQSAIYIREINTDNPLQITQGAGFENFDAFTPDGKSLESFIGKISSEQERQELIETLTNSDVSTDTHTDDTKTRGKKRERILIIENNGSSHYIRWNEYRYLDEEGKTYAVGLFEDCTEEILEKQELERLRKAELEKIEYEAHHDALTGLLNRHAYEEAMEILQSSTDPTAFVLIDLNDLHELNASFTDKGGDRVIQRVANDIVSLIGLDQEKLLPGEGIYRIGGDEFIIILRNFSREGLDSVLSRLKDHFGLKNQKEYNAKASLSIGGVFIPGGIDENAQDIRAHVFELADEVVYMLKSRAKRFDYFGKSWKETSVDSYDENIYGSVEQILANQRGRPTRKTR